MAAVTTRKPIDLPALIAAVGVDLEMTGEGLVVISGDVDQQTLNDAVAAHVAHPQPSAADLQGQLDDIISILLGG